MYMFAPLCRIIVSKTKTLIPKLQFYKYRFDKSSVTQNTYRLGVDREHNTIVC